MGKGSVEENCSINEQLPQATQARGSSGALPAGALLAFTPGCVRMDLQEPGLLKLRINTGLHPCSPCATLLGLSVTSPGLSVLS